MDLDEKSKLYALRCLYDSKSTRPDHIGIARSALKALAGGDEGLVVERAGGFFITPDGIRWMLVHGGPFTDLPEAWE